MINILLLDLKELNMTVLFSTITYKKALYKLGMLCYVIELY